MKLCYIGHFKTRWFSKDYNGGEDGGQLGLILWWNGLAEASRSAQGQPLIFNCGVSYDINLVK